MGLTGSPPDYLADFVHTPSQGVKSGLSRVLLFCSSHCCAAGPLARSAAPVARRRCLATLRFGAARLRPVVPFTFSYNEPSIVGPACGLSDQRLPWIKVFTRELST